MADIAQNYQTHRKFVPLFHYVLLPILMLNVLAMAYHLWQNPNMFTAWALVMGIAFALTALFARVFALAAQDRVIRLEERGFRSTADLEKLVADGDLAAAILVPDGYGRALLYGSGVAQNVPAAADWIRKAASLSVPEGIFLRGVLYAYGRGEPKDDAEAFNEYRRSAEEGYVDGQLQTAGMYLTGRGAKQSDNAAAAWYLRAAEAGSPDAQAMLGWMHEVGRGVPKDLGESVRWYRLAAAQGNSVARDHLKYLETLP